MELLIFTQTINEVKMLREIALYFFI